MDFSKLIEEIKSGIVHFLFLNPKGEKIASGSGFLSGGKVITCDHVISQPFSEDTEVHLRFEDNPKDDFSADIVYSLPRLREKVELASPEADNDYCLLNIPEIKYSNRHNFEISDVGEAEVGTEILFMGYPFDHLNLVSHRGYISSIFIKNGIEVLQLDASVNASNSGGPLIHPYTKKVLGIITRKETSLSKNFDQLIDALEQNAQAFANPIGGNILMGGISIRDAFLVIQRQLKIVAVNMKRSSNAGIGFAFGLSSLNHL